MQVLLLVSFATDVSTQHR